MPATQPQTQVNVQQVVPFVMVADMGASMKFYVEGLGFHVVHKWEPDGHVRWCWLTLGAASLMLQQRDPSRAPEGKVGEGLAPYFICRDALAVYREITGRGVDVKHEPIVSNHMWFFTVDDPDGYRLAFESQTDQHEGMTFSEYEWSKA